MSKYLLALLLAVTYCLVFMLLVFYLPSYTKESLVSSGLEYE